jgi:hypothetical protein
MTATYEWSMIICDIAVRVLLRHYADTYICRNLL